MKRAFTLIELLVALAITSVVITLLFNSFLQTTMIVTRADNIMSINTRAALIQHQLEKDIMGAFLPVQAFRDREDQQQKDKKANNMKTFDKKPSPKKRTEKEELKKIFYGINRGIMLDLLTFITNNPMSAYWGAKTGRAKPKIARIVYRLEEDSNRENSSTLYRQEGAKLEFEPYSKAEGVSQIRAYPLAEGIKELTVKYRVVLEEEEEKGTREEQAEKAGKKKKEKKKETQFKTFDQWNLEKEMPKNVKRRIPNVVDIKLVLWDDKGDRDATFEFSIPIIPNISEKPIKKQSEESKNRSQNNLDQRKRDGQKTVHSGGDQQVWARQELPCSNSAQQNTYSHAQQHVTYLTTTSTDKNALPQLFICNKAGENHE